MKSRKKIIIGISIFTIVFLVGWMAYSSFTIIKSKQEIASGIGRIPEFQLLSNDSLSNSVKSTFNDNPLVILYFNTSCDYCLSEIQDIVTNKDKLKKINFLMISLEGIKSIREFGDQTGLAEMSNVVLGKIDDKTADEILGISSAPQLFIYNRDGILTKQFKGRTKIETIIKYANQI